MKLNIKNIHWKKLIARNALLISGLVILIIAIGSYVGLRLNGYLAPTTTTAPGTKPIVTLCATDRTDSNTPLTALPSGGKVDYDNGLGQLQLPMTNATITGLPILYGYISYSNNVCK
jgi:hypothetical protein